MQKGAKLLLLCMGVGLLLAWVLGPFAGTWSNHPRQDPLIAADEEAEELLRAALKRDWTVARQHIDRLVAGFTRQDVPVTVNWDGVHAVSASILEAQQAFSSTDADEEKLLWHANRVRLAVDALRHGHQPLWREYSAAFADQMQRLLDAAVKREEPALRRQFAENYRLYGALQPAMSVQVDGAQLAELNKSYHALQEELGKAEIDWPVVREGLRTLRHSIQEAFTDRDAATMGPWMSSDSPLTLMVTVAFILTVTLGYVGWRKYVGEERVP